MEACLALCLNQDLVQGLVRCLVLELIRCLTSRSGRERNVLADRGRMLSCLDTGSRYQNSKPVASQFVADPKPSLFDDEPETSRTSGRSSVSGRSSLSEGNFKSVRALNAAKRYMETHSSHPDSRGTGSSAASVSSSQLHLLAVLLAVCRRE